MKKPGAGLSPAPGRLGNACSSYGAAKKVFTLVMRSAF